MTEKEKAIEWLTACKETNYRHSPTIQGYMDMAISALKEEPVPFDFELFQAGLMDMPKGMTNGEVIQATFPNADYELGKHFMHITNINSIGEISVPLDWWNSPYKKGGE